MADLVEGLEEVHYQDVTLFFGLHVFYEVVYKLEELVLA